MNKKNPIKSRFAAGALVVGMVVLNTLNAGATSIAVSNSGFDMDGAANVSPPTSWIGGNTQASSSYLATTAPGNGAYLLQLAGNYGDFTAVQDTTYHVQAAGETLKVTAAIGKFTAFTAETAANYVGLVSIRVNGAIVASNTLINTTEPPYGGFADAYATYTTTAADVGKIVGVELGGPGFTDTAYGHWKFFDNVRLETSAPPPTTTTGSVAVTNPSFEVNAVQNGGTPQGWTGSSDLHHAPNDYFNYSPAPDGSYYTYMNYAWGHTGITQDGINTISVAGQIYTMTVAIGNFAPFANDTGADYVGLIKLRVNGVVVATNPAGTTGSPASGAWADASVSYTTTAADVGKSIGIGLMNPGTANGGVGDQWKAYDNVRLTVTTPQVTTPPPTSTVSISMLDPGFDVDGAPEMRPAGWLGGETKEGNGSLDCLSQGYYMQLRGTEKVAVTNGYTSTQNRIYRIRVAGEVLTLTVAEGNYNDTQFPNLTAASYVGLLSLQLNGTTVASNTAATTAAPPRGGWADASVSYTTTSTDIGKVVSIQLGGPVFQSAYTSGNHNWRFFDNVRLSTVGAFPPVVITPYPTPVAAAPDPTDVFPYTNETAAQKTARMAWWREARFGMFIHWGLYAQLGGQYNGTNYSGNGEWTMWGLQIPEANYQAFAPQFNPTQFNATTWTNIAKTAGMKYVVMTAKHHEGFAMYHSAASTFNLYDATPFKRDPLDEMNTATTTAGLKFGIYYSQNLDWNHPGGGMTFGPSWDPAQNGNYDTYISTVSAPQVQEILTRYHPSVLWWDMPGAMSDTNYGLLTGHLSQIPGLITNDRLGAGPYDFAVEEQAIPVGTLSTDWEECMTINDTWGYKTLDTDWKSSQTLLSNLINVVSKGGNYLLNVGPDATGVIPQPEVDRLNAMGAWLSANGESIYGATYSPYTVSGFTGYTTYQNNKLYLHVFSWPYESPITVTGITKTVLSAKWLSNGESLTVTTSGGNVTISEPTMLDPLCTTVVLTLSP